MELLNVLAMFRCRQEAEKAKVSNCNCGVENMHITKSLRFTGVNGWSRVVFCLKTRLLNKTLNKDPSDIVRRARYKQIIFPLICYEIMLSSIYQNCRMCGHKRSGISINIDMCYSYDRVFDTNWSSIKCVWATRSILFFITTLDIAVSLCT